MRTFKGIVLTGFILLMVTSIAPANAATVEVKWDEISSFTDVETVHSKKEAFEQSIISDLTEHLIKLGEQLPAANRLLVTVHDVDLAGRVEPVFGSYSTSFQRVLNDLTYPEMVISYEYFDNQGAVIQSAQMLELKNMAPNFTRKSAMASGRDNFYHEKKLLTRWFNETFEK